MNNCKVTARTLPDLSAAFGSINLTILMDRVSLWYGVSDVAI